MLSEDLKILKKQGQGSQVAPQIAKYHHTIPMYPLKFFFAYSRKDNLILTKSGSYMAYQPGPFMAQLWSYIFDIAW